MRDYYCLLLGGSVQQVKARDLPTAASEVERRYPGLMQAAMTESAWHEYRTQAINAGADEPRYMTPMVARSHLYG